MTVRGLLSSLLLCTSLGAPRLAEAQAPEDRGENVGKVLAEALYQKGRELMLAKDYAAACPKFEESYRLDAATGTLLNLATCHELQGKLAAAWLEFNNGRQSARLDGRLDRVKFADDHLAVLEKRLPWIAFKFPEGAGSDLNLLLDGMSVPTDARDVNTPLDPGTHEVQVVAPGKKPWTGTFEVVEGQRLTVEVPPLQDLPLAAKEVAVGPVPAPATPERLPPALASHAPLQSVADRGSSSTTVAPTSVRPEAWIFGVSAVTLGIASGVTGVLYLDRRAEYRDAKDTESYAARSSNFDRAAGMQTANTVLVAATVGSTALALFYLLEGEKPKHSSASVAAGVGPSGNAVVLSGSF